MSDQPQDPYRHWDGQRWLRWDSTAWVPEVAEAVVAPPVDEPPHRHAAPEPSAAPELLPPGQAAEGPLPTGPPLTSVEAGGRKGIRTGRAILAMVVFLIVGLIVGVAIGASSKGTPVSAGPSATATVTETSTVTAMPLATTGSTDTPSPATTGAGGQQVLLVAQGTGIKGLPRFSTTGDWTLAYTYNCAAFGGSGNFAVSDDDPTNSNIYVNELGAKGGSSSSESSTGSHKLSVNSECVWTIKVTQP